MSAEAKKPTILEKIYAQRAQDVELAKSTPGTTPKDLAALLSMHLAPPLIPLVQRLKRNPSTSTSSASPSPSLMAEIKRASPSKGPIALEANAAQQALTYALAGASVISVLTEPTWFKGSLLDMRLARQAVDALPDRPAILRKEFILDEYQIAEARLWGADTVLLIVAMLSQERLKALYAYSCSMGMEPLVEVNNAAEMQRALELDAKVIGVNNRNLHDFNVDMGTTSRLAELVKDRDIILCALSGISGAADVRVYKEQGVRAVLVGEALMRAKDTAHFIRELLEWPVQTQNGEIAIAKKPWVKVTGVRSADEAVSLSSAGADMLSFVFDPESKQHVTVETAAPVCAAIRASRLPSPVPPSQTLESELYRDAAPWFTSRQRVLTATSARPLLVGVFKNQSLAFIQRAVATAQLDLVQLDGDEPAGWVQHIPVPVIRKFRVSEIQTGDTLTRPGSHAFALLEGAREDLMRMKELGGRNEVPGWPMPVILRGVGKDISSGWGDGAGGVTAWAVDLDVDEEGGVEAMVHDLRGGKNRN